MPVRVLQHKPQGGTQNLFVRCPRDGRYQMSGEDTIPLPFVLLFLSFSSLGAVGVSARQEVTVIASVLMFAVKGQCRPWGY